MRLTLILLPERYAVCRFAPGAAIPAWALDGPFCSITRTADELSAVCLDAAVPPEVQCEHGWRAIKFSGPFDFALVGILVAVAQPLAAAGISIFAISTYDTDYILVREQQYAATLAVLQAEQHRLIAA
jgi:hypothetical protein